MMRLNAALLVLTPLFYLAAFAAYKSSLDERRTSRISQPILLLGLALIVHFALLWVRGALIGQPPWTTYYDTFSAIAFLMTLTYILVEIVCHNSSTGYDFLPVPFAFLTYSAAFGPHVPKQNPLLDSELFTMHTVPAIGGVAALLVGGFYGVLYLRLSRAMQRKQFEGFFQRMPELETLARMNFASLIVGLILVTAAIGWGATWYGDVFQRVDIFQPKITFTLVVWLILFIPLIGRMLKRWSDRWTALCSVVILVLVSMSIMVSVLPIFGFHGHN